jgi:putative oxidoreductase
MALLAGNAENLGGLALIDGLRVCPAAIVHAITILVAIFAVHVGNGLVMSDNGYEFGLVFLTANGVFAS